jgi:serine/threonine protein phosphatase PrpC
MRVRVGARTDVGRVRERNEDSYLVQDPLYVVADGMGGHRGGDVASSMILESLEGVELPPDDLLASLVEEIKKANVEVLRRGESDKDLHGMGTTLTAFLTDDDRAYVAHVGDSRAYLLRDGAIQRLTRDHTLVERMVEQGRLRPDQARDHPQQNILTRVLGVEDDVEVDDLTLEPIQPGDRVLLCTDGLTHMVDDEEIEQILKDEADPQAACDLLVEAALAAGGEDNITVLVLDIEEGDPSTAAEVGRGSRGQSQPNPALAATSPPRADTIVQRPIEAGAGDEREEPHRRGRIRRWILRLAVLVILIVVAVVGLRIYVNQQWYVGESAERVAIYHGIPTTLLGFDLSHVAAQTDLTAAEVERIRFYRDLADGITADSFQEAQRIVSQMRQDVQDTQGVQP